MTDRIFTGANGRKYINNEPRLHPTQHNFCPRCGKRTTDIHTCTPPLADGDKVAPTEPVQEPVAWQWLDTAHFRKKIPAHATPAHWRPLYAAPPQRKPLTEEEIYSLFRTVASPVMFARAIERAHGIKE